MIKHKLTLQEAYILEWILHLPIWADKSILYDKTIYFASKNKACQDLPMITKQNDTMQRYYRRLEEHGMIKLYKVSNKDYIEILPKCGEWNSVTTKRSEEHVGSDGMNTSDRPINSNIKNNSVSNSTLFDQEKIQNIPEEILKYLNKQKPSPIDFKPTASNLKEIKARIQEGFTKVNFKTVIDCKIREWKNSAKMKKFIRPATLFGSKFNGYLIEASTGTNDGSDNFQFTPTKKVTML
ncbi:MAG: conserved phage C-terminal domain-containing protein [Candidatus Heimdallarchaeota archaeon]|nr:conserved phage C-terminal domain-containing protein [Candidatus Heimdallarchaeota archaeon]